MIRTDERAAALHDDLKRWLVRDHPYAPALVVLTALSYEIGRLCGQLTDGMSDLEMRAMVNGVRNAMLEHVAAYRKGLRD